MFSFAGNKKFSDALVHDIGSHLVSLDIKNLSDDSRRAKNG